jgi:hypothetical protein
MKFECEIGGIRVRASCARILAPQAESVLDTFAQLAKGGTVLHDGLQIRFGWSLLRLVAEGDGLMIAEPDFKQWPSDLWKPSVDTTLKVLSDQIRLLKKLNISGSDATLDQNIFASQGALESEEFFLRRSDARSDQDSGWLLGTLSDPEALTREDGLQAILIAHLVTEHLPLLQVLALPSDFIAIFRQGILREIFDSNGEHHPIA